MASNMREIVGYLKVPVPPGWSELQRGNPKVLTFVKAEDRATGIQISVRPGAGVGKASADGLALFAAGYLRDIEGASGIEAGSPPAAFGSAGTARSEHLGERAQKQGIGFAQVWFLSNGRDLVFATHFGAVRPSDALIVELEAFVSSIESAVTAPP